MVSLTSGRLRVCKDSIGGISKIYMFPFVKYTRSQIIKNGLTLTSFPETNIFEFDNNPEFNNQQEENEGGKYYTENLTLEFKGFQLNDEFEKFLKQDFRVIVLDRNGKYRLLGAYNGLTCDNVEKLTGDSKNSFKGYRVSFTGQEEQPSLFITDLEDAGFAIYTPSFLLLEDEYYLLQEDGLSKIILY